MASRFWRGCRIGFRCLRIAVLLVLLVAACVLLYFNQIGLPAFLKDPLLASLEQRGVHLEFDRMRMRMTRGIVVERVRVGAAGNANSPTLTLGEVQLLLDFERLLHGRWEVQGLVVRGGCLAVPVVAAGGAATTLELTNIQTDVRFPGSDTWSLDNFQAGFKGATLALSGDVAHASELRNWDIFRPSTNGTPANWQQRLQTLSEIVGKIRLEGAPRLTLNIEGDAREINSFAIRLNITAPAAHTPWFSARQLQLNASLAALANYPTNPLVPGIWTNLQPYRLAWSAHFTQMRAANVSAAAVTAGGFWHAPELALSLHLQTARMRAPGPEFSVATLQLGAHVTALGMPARPVSWPGVGSNLPPCELDWSASFSRFVAEPLQVATASANGFWRAPKLVVTNLVMNLGGGRLAAALDFDAARQRLWFTNASNFDPSIVAPWLPPLTRERLGWFTWQDFPAVQAAGTLDLSAWPGRREIPVAVAGSVAATHPTVSGVDLDTVQTRFAYSNHVWQVADLQVARQLTRLRLNAAEDESTKRFTARVQGAFDVNQIRPFLKTKGAIREVGRLTFHEPLALDLTIDGQLHQAETLAVAGQLALTNFAARGGELDHLTTGITYSNLVIAFNHPQADRRQGSQKLSADQIRVDLNEHRIYFVNGYSTAEPQAIANAIGPKTGHTLEPYQFLTPPTARVNGFVSLKSSEDNQQIEAEDLQVDILRGAPFRWLRFESQRIEGSAHWFGPTLLLTNLSAEFYQGRASGWALFDFRPRAGTDFQFAFDITNANLHRLIAGLASPTNQLEGLVGGRLVVTSGNSTNWQAMSGYGNATLQDGLIWDAPMFGILSPALNALSPGLGSSRATDAAGIFTMTNGVIFSSDLEIHSTMMRLRYAGTVDLHENLNARATTQILRDTPGLGEIIHVISWPVSKLFEYKVTGTLGDPKMAPLNDVAKLIMAPLHPFKTLENLIPAANTNNPTVFTNSPARK